MLIHSQYNNDNYLQSKQAVYTIHNIHHMIKIPISTSKPNKVHILFYYWYHLLVNIHKKTSQLYNFNLFCNGIVYQQCSIIYQ